MDLLGKAEKISASQAELNTAICPLPALMVKRGAKSYNA